MFYALSILTAILVWFFAAVMLSNPLMFKKLPRLAWAGMVVGVPCLVWSAKAACLMLEGPLAKFHIIVWALVPIAAVLAWFFLDYLFARAVGGFFILAANELLHQAFAANICVRPLYSAVCLVIGICGLFVLGVPWYMRDAIILAGNNKKLGIVIGSILILCGFVLILLPFFRN